MTWKSDEGRDSESALRRIDPPGIAGLMLVGFGGGRWWDIAARGPWRLRRTVAGALLLTELQTILLGFGLGRRARKLHSAQ
jgi:hypothetical protein